MPESPPFAAADREAAETTSRILLETKSVLFSPEKPFTFTSGRVSPVYIDCRRLISFPRARRKLMDMGAAMIERRVGHESIDAVAGGETAGIPFAAWLAERLALPMLYVRKKAKGFGRNAQIEGEMAEGARVLLVEDLASEGTSKLNFVRAIREAGGTIGHTFVVFHYGIFPQSIASLAAEQVQLHALATWWDVLATAESLGYFTPAQFAAVKSFLEKPDGWRPAADRPLEAPSPDALAAAIKKMVAKGKERGYVTFDELSAALPPDQVSGEQIEDVMTMLTELGINVVENDERA